MKKAELKPNGFGIAESLEPYVKITQFDKSWKSEAKEGGGLTPEWHMQTYEFDVMNLLAEVGIEVRD